MKVYKLILFILVINLLFSIDKIDINNADINNLSSIPLSENKIHMIYEYMSTYGELESIYDLLNIYDITSEDMEMLKKYITISKLSENNNYRYDALELLSEDGIPHTGITEFLVDNYYNPINVNYINSRKFL